MAGRKKKIKKSEEHADEKTDVLDLEELNLELDDDDEQASELELEEFDDEATAELHLDDADPEEKKQPKSRKKKSPKKAAKKAAKSETGESEEDRIEPVEISLESPRQEATLVAGAMHQSMEAMAKQWVAVKETTDQVSKNFERVSGMLGELPGAYQKMLDDLARTHRPRPTAGTRAAIALSAMAVILSGISLLFSQSVRQVVLSRPIPSQAVATNAAPRPKAVAPEIAVKTPESDLSRFKEETTAVKREPVRPERKKTRRPSRKRSRR